MKLNTPLQHFSQIVTIKLQIIHINNQLDRIITNSRMKSYISVKLTTKGANIMKVKLINPNKLLSLIFISFFSYGCIDLVGEYDSVTLESSDLIEDDSNGIKEPTPSLPNNDGILTPAFLATGQQGSSMYSCDGGLSWQGYKAFDPQRCDDPELVGDCDHKSFSGKGVVWTPSGFVLHYGHGYLGPVQRSKNGKDWETLVEERRFGDVAFGNETLVLIDGSNPTFSNDYGDNFMPGEKETFDGNIRGITFVPHGANGVFIVQTNGGGLSGISVSNDLGRSYSSASLVPATCSTGSLAFSETRIIISSEDLCYSDDAGQTWSVIQGAPFNRNHIIYNGTEFKVFSRDSVYSSVDGFSWSEQAILIDGKTPPNWFSIENATYHKELNRYVSIEGFPSSYEETGFFYSDDAVNWTQVTNPNNKPTAPHEVIKIATGYLEECN